MVFAGQRAPNARTTVFLLFLLQLAATLIVPWCGSNGSPPELLYLFTVASGASIGGVLIIRALITSEMFGAREYASIQGVVQAAVLRSEERVKGKRVAVRVDLGGRRIIKKKTTIT